MARAPTLGRRELEELRTVENVIRLGHVRFVEPGRLYLSKGDTTLAPDAVVVHCAAEGLRQPPLVTLWRPAVITLQPIRAGFPCFGAALAGYVEATRHDDAEKNRLCPPSPYGNSATDWARMQVMGGRAAAAFSAEPDIRAWTDEVPLNPARVPAARASDPAVRTAQDRLRVATPAAMAQLAALPGSEPVATRGPMIKRLSALRRRGRPCTGIVDLLASAAKDGARKWKASERRDTTRSTTVPRR